MTQFSSPRLEALLDELQAAAMLSLSVRTLQAWRVRREGPPFIRLGRAVRYRHADIVSWLNEHTQRCANGQPLNSHRAASGGRAHG